MIITITETAEHKPTIGADILSFRVRFQAKGCHALKLHSFDTRSLEMSIVKLVPTAQNCSQRFEHFTNPTICTSQMLSILINTHLLMRRGVPRMFASLDCMHREWKNCLVAWQDDFRNGNCKKLIILEAISTLDLHIWYAFFGLPGSSNDLNV